MAKSVSILGMLLPRKNCSLSTQCPVVIRGSQAMATGEHWKITTSSMDMNHIVATVPKIPVPYFTNRVGKRRRYMLKTLNLTVVMRET